MRFKTRMTLTLGCVALLAIGVPALSQPKPGNSERQQKTQSHRAAQTNNVAHRAAKGKANRGAGREDRAVHLASLPISQEPKRPAFGWPVLVSEARKYLGTNPTDRKRLWCATFMNMVLAKTGYSGTNSDAAKSFAQYGRRISEPKVGAIAVLTRGKRGGHVGVVSGIDANGNPIIISGNHGHRVGEAIYPRSRVIAYVMPSGRGPGRTEVADRGVAGRSTPESVLDSPIAELLAAIEAEQNRSDRSRQGSSHQASSRQEFSRQDRALQAAQPAPPPVPHLTVQQTAEPVAPSRRQLPLEPGLAEFFGIKERAQNAPRPAPQREQRVEQRQSYRVAADTGLAGSLDLLLAR